MARRNEMSRRPSIRVRWRKRGGGVVTHSGERRAVETHVTGRSCGADEGRGWGMRMGGPCSAAGIVFSYNFIDSSREVDREIFLQVARRTRKVSMVGLCQLCGPVNESEEARADAPKGFYDAWDDRFALGSWVASNLVFLTGIRRKAGGGKGSRGIP